MPFSCKRIVRLAALLPLLAIPALSGTAVSAQESEEDLAKKLSNPVAAMISVPFQYNYNQGFGTGNGTQSYINIQPVIPITLNDEWNLISRTIVPVISQDIIPGQKQNGFGNTTQSFFFSPKNPTKGGIIWGAGPVISIPTNTDGLGTDQWGLGVTGVVLKQSKGWTYGALANHIWSVTKNSEYGESSTTFLQPFLSYTTKKALTIGINTESTYDWENDTWSVPINFTVGQIIKIDGRPVQLTAGIRYWAESPNGAAQDWGGRLVVTYLFPKKG